MPPKPADRGHKKSAAPPITAWQRATIAAQIADRAIFSPTPVTRGGGEERGPTGLARPVRVLRKRERHDEARLRFACDVVLVQCLPHRGHGVDPERARAVDVQLLEDFLDGLFVRLDRLSRRKTNVLN